MYIHHHEVRLILGADVEDRADVRVHERGEERASRSKRNRQVGSSANDGDRILRATVR